MQFSHGCHDQAMSLAGRQNQRILAVTPAGRYLKNWQRYTKANSRRSVSLRLFPFSAFIDLFQESGISSDNDMSLCWPVPVFVCLFPR